MVKGVVSNPLFQIFLDPALGLGGVLVVCGECYNLG